LAVVVGCVVIVPTIPLGVGVGGGGGGGGGVGWSKGGKMLIIHFMGLCGDGLGEGLGIGGGGGVGDATVGCGTGGGGVGENFGIGTAGTGGELEHTRSSEPRERRMPKRKIRTSMKSLL